MAWTCCVHYQFHLWLGHAVYIISFTCGLDMLCTLSVSPVAWTCCVHYQFHLWLGHAVYIISFTCGLDMLCTLSVSPVTWTCCVHDQFHLWLGHAVYIISFTCGLDMLCMYVGCRYIICVSMSSDTCQLKTFMYWIWSRGMGSSKQLCLLLGNVFV